MIDRKILVGLLGCIAFQAYGMKRALTTQEAAALKRPKHNQIVSIDILPEDNLQEVIECAIIADPTFAHATPCISRLWREKANSPAVIISVISQLGMPGSIRRLSGSKEYITANKALAHMCRNQDSSIEELKATLKNPYTDINCLLDTLGQNHLSGTHLIEAASSSNTQAITFLSEHNARTDDTPGYQPLLYYTLKSPLEEHTASNITNFKALRSAGAQPDTESLKLAFERCRMHDEYNDLIIEDKDFVKSTINQPVFGLPPFHAFLSTNKTSMQYIPSLSRTENIPLNPPCAKVVTHLMRNCNANPHSSFRGKTVYHLAKEWARQGHPEYLEAIKQHDQGCESYT